nr:sporulation protein YtfJ [Clostridia bacterium]
MQSENRINSVVENALKSVRDLVDVNTVVGTPIKTETGDCIIPVSKVSFGILSGGGEYGKIKIFKNSSDLPFSAGNGTLVSVKPCGFLIRTEDGEYKVVSAGYGAYDAMFDKVVDFFENLTAGDENGDDND